MDLAGRRPSAVRLSPDLRCLALLLGQPGSVPLGGSPADASVGGDALLRLGTRAHALLRAARCT